MASALVPTQNGARPAVRLRPTPATASERRYLRDGLPEIYRAEGSFAMRFLEAMEQVLDPVIATADSLGAHLDADLAPRHALAGLATWLGVADVERLHPIQRREAVRRAGELCRLRGTRAGLQLALELFFPGIPMRIDDHGKVTVTDDPDEVVGDPGAPTFDVYCDQPLAPEDQMAVADCIERWKPVTAHYRLRVKKGDTGETMAAPGAKKRGGKKKPSPGESASPEGDE